MAAEDDRDRPAGGSAEQGTPGAREGADGAEREQLPVELAGARLPRYRRLRRNVFVATAVVSLLPLIIFTGINFFQDRAAYQAENTFDVSQILSNTKRTLEFVIEERRGALALLIREQSYDALAVNGALARALQNLNNSFGGFVDLGLIDPRGIQAYYTGPYDLQDRSYEDQAWFHEVVLRGTYVSDVFMGHRHFPHFVIAIRHERAPGEYYIIRATIDMDLINRQMQGVHQSEETDVFIVNQSGILQTESIF